MSDLPDFGAPPDEDEAPVQTTLADLPGQLKEWLGNVPGRVAGWAQDAATVVNDFITRRDISDTATAQSQAFTANVQQFSSGLDEVVRADPTATNMALGLAALTVPALVADHPYLPDDQRGPVTEALAGQVGQSIARNAVISWAQRDPDTAHAELKRLGGLFSADERTALGDHVDLLGQALDQDAEAASIQAANDAANRAHATTVAYADELVGPDGQPRFPGDWVRRVVNDQNVPPADTALLQRMQARLRGLSTQYAGAPPPLTDGSKITDFLTMAQGGRETQKELLDHIGRDLDLKDAQTLIAASRNPAELNYLNSTMALAKRAIQGPDGELGVDGQESMGRFVQKFLTEYRTLGRGALDPDNPNFLGALRGFAGKDEMNARLHTEEKAQSLADIFARKQHEHAVHTAAQRDEQRAHFDLQHKLSEVHEKQALRKHEEERDQRAQEREWRLEQKGFHDKFVADQAQQRAQAHLDAQAAARSDKRVADAHIGRAEHTPAEHNPADTFRKFLGLGRPERA